MVSFTDRIFSGLTNLCSIGEDAMIHLLTETSIFVSLPNGCLCQITGEPLIHISPKSRVVEPSQQTQPQQSNIKGNQTGMDGWCEPTATNQATETWKSITGRKKLTPAKLYVLILSSWIWVSCTTVLHQQMYIYPEWRSSMQSRTICHIPIGCSSAYRSGVSTLLAHISLPFHPT
jgi:hypothetical protein